MAEYTTTTTYKIRCPKCEGDSVKKHGKQSGEQRYLCKKCKKAFRANGKAEGRRMDADLMGAAIGDYYDGKSYKKITEALEKEYDLDTEPSKATVFAWVQQYAGEAVEDMKDHKLPTGGSWVADEMELKVGGKRAWNWNVMDEETRLILASYLSYRRDGHAARAVIRKAAEAADKPPKTVKTDKWRAYIKPIKDILPEAKHIQSEGLSAQINNNLSERLQGTFRDRTKTLRGLEGIESGQRYLDGWVLNYNLFRKHESLGNKTPAQKAGFEPPYHEWADVVKVDAALPVAVSEEERRAEIPKAELRTVEADTAEPPLTERPTRSESSRGQPPTRVRSQGHGEPRAVKPKATAPRRREKPATAHPRYWTRKRNQRPLRRGR